MGRRAKEREIGHLPKLTHFLPAAPGREDTVAPGTVCLGLDELEALRLAHLEGLEQNLACSALGISRPTFGRILASAHGKVTRALVEGRPLLIDGGEVVLDAGPRLCLGCSSVVSGQDIEDVVDRRSPCCSASTRPLVEAEVAGLDDAHLARLGDGLSADQKRAYLVRAIRLARNGRWADDDSRSPLGGP